MEKGIRMVRWHVLDRQVDHLFNLGSRADLEKARALLLEQYELVPSHPVALYNLACVESLLGNFLPALDYLEKSIHLGWNDLAHMQQDTDLDALRHLDHYKNLVAILEAQQSASSSPIQANEPIPLQQQKESVVPQFKDPMTVQEQEATQNQPSITLPTVQHVQQEVLDELEVKLNMLSAMGFSDREKMVFALESGGGNVHAAVAVLLNI